MQRQEHLSMLFNPEKFFFDEKKEVKTDTYKQNFLTKLYQNERPIYFNRRSSLDDFRGNPPETQPSVDYIKMTQQIDHVIKAIKKYIEKHFPKLPAENLDILAKNLSQWLEPTDAEGWYSQGKEYLENILYHLENPDISSTVKHEVMYEMLPLITLCVAGALSNTNIANSKFVYTARDIFKTIWETTFCQYIKKILGPLRANNEGHLINAIRNRYHESFYVTQIIDNNADFTGWDEKYGPAFLKRMEEAAPYMMISAMQNLVLYFKQILQTVINQETADNFNHALSLMGKDKINLNTFLKPFNYTLKIIADEKKEDISYKRDIIYIRMQNGSLEYSFLNIKEHKDTLVTKYISLETLGFKPNTPFESIDQNKLLENLLKITNKDGDTRTLVPIDDDDLINQQLEQTLFFRLLESGVINKSHFSISPLNKDNPSCALVYTAAHIDDTSQIDSKLTHAYYMIDGYATVGFFMVNSRPNRDFLKKALSGKPEGFYYFKTFTKDTYQIYCVSYNKVNGILQPTQAFNISSDVKDEDFAKILELNLQGQKIKDIKPETYLQLSKEEIIELNKLTHKNYNVKKLLYFSPDAPPKNIPIQKEDFENLKIALKLDKASHITLSFSQMNMIEYYTNHHHIHPMLIYHHNTIPAFSWRIYPGHLRQRGLIKDDLMEAQSADDFTRYYIGLPEDVKRLTLIHSTSYLKTSIIEQLYLTLPDFISAQSLMHYTILGDEVTIQKLTSPKMLLHLFSDSKIVPQLIEISAQYNNPHIAAIFFRKNFPIKVGGPEIKTLSLTYFKNNSAPALALLERFLDEKPISIINLYTFVQLMLNKTHPRLYKLWAKVQSILPSLVASIAQQTPQPSSLEMDQLNLIPNMIDNEVKTEFLSSPTNVIRRMIAEGFAFPDFKEADKIEGLFIKIVQSNDELLLKKLMEKYPSLKEQRVLQYHPSPSDKLLITFIKAGGGLNDLIAGISQTNEVIFNRLLSLGLQVHPEVLLTILITKMVESYDLSSFEKFFKKRLEKVFINTLPIDRDKYANLCLKVFIGEIQKFWQTKKNPGILKDKFIIAKFLFEVLGAHLPNDFTNISLPPGFTRYLLIENNEYNDDAHQPDEDGNTPLFLAVRKKPRPNKTLIKTYLELKVNPNIYNHAGEHVFSPLLLSKGKGKHRLMFELLIENSGMIDINKRLSHTKKSHTFLTRAIEIQHVELISLLLKQGADVTLPGKKNLSPLEYALKSKNSKIIELIKEALTSKDQATVVATHPTPISNPLETQKTFPTGCLPPLQQIGLFSSSFEKNPRKRMRTPVKSNKMNQKRAVFEAIEKGDVVKLKELLADKSINISQLICPTRGISAFLFSLEKNNTEITDLLLQASAREEDDFPIEDQPLTMICLNTLRSKKQRPDDEVKEEEPEKEDKYSEAMLKAIETGDNSALRRILDICNPNFIDKTRAVTPLIAAIVHKNDEAIMILLEKNADPNTTDSRGYSPVYHAFLSDISEDKKIGLIDYLRTRGASVNFTTPNAISIAEEAEHRYPRYERLQEFFNQYKQTPVKLKR